MKNRKIVITGGAGFIGRYFIKKLNKENNIRILDKIEKPKHIPEDVRYKQVDLCKKQNIDLFDEVNLVINLASLVDVQESIRDTRKAYNNNLYSIINVLENMVQYDVPNIIYTSTSAVYGDDLKLPVDETHTKKPVSDYGSSKLAAENLIRTRSNIDNFNFYNFRLGNIVGYNGHGVIQDFINKLNDNPDELQILGNGKQEKSYLYVKDCVDGILKTFKSGDPETYNLSSEDTINVDKIAEIVSDVMDIDPVYKYTGGEKGWVGDVPKYRLDISKIRNNTEWDPSYSSSESVRRTVEESVK